MAVEQQRRMSGSRSKKGPEFSPETLRAIEELCLVLKPIYLRMRRQGYVIIDGKFVKPKENENKE